MLKKRAFVRVHPQRVASHYLLSGLAKCGYCGKSLVGQDAKGGQFHYYVCGTLLKKGAGSCPARYINSQKLEKMVINKVKEHILTRDHLRQHQEKLQITRQELGSLLSDRRVELADLGTVTQYVECLHSLLMESTLAERKSFIKSFIKEVRITESEVVLNYTIPMPPEGYPKIG